MCPSGAGFLDFAQRLRLENSKIAGVRMQLMQLLSAIYFDVPNIR
jgi:hypothetical protein